LANPHSIDLTSVTKEDRGGVYTFKGGLPASESGSYGFNVRVIPTHKNVLQEHELRLISWGR
jgi:hypothetical protein